MSFQYKYLLYTFTILLYLLQINFINSIYIYIPTVLYSILNPIVVIKQFLVNYIFHYNKIIFLVSLVQTQSVCRTQWSKLEQRVLAFRAKGLLAKSQPLDPLPFLIDHWKLACRQLLVSLGSGRILILWIQLITTTNSFNS